MKKIKYGRRPIRIEKNVTSLTNKEPPKEYYAKVMELAEKFKKGN